MERYALTMNYGHGAESTDCLNHSYVQLCEGLGIKSVPISNAISDPVSYMTGLDISGLILTGGNDISLPDAPQNTSSAAPLRDRVERKLLAKAVELELPVFGICRGMQFINVFFGGGLFYDLNQRSLATEGHVGRLHKVRITDDTIQACVGTDNFQVNSFHNHGVTIDQVSPALRVFAISEKDRVVEGLIHPTLQIMGIQWHPERPGSSPENDQRLLAGFLRAEFWESRRKKS